MLFDFPLSFQAFATMILIQVHCPTVIYYYQNYLKAVRLRYFRLGGRKGENKAAVGSWEARGSSATFHSSRSLLMVPAAISLGCI